MKQLFQKSNILRVLTYFFENPYSESYLREIARKTKISPSTLSRSLDFLAEEGLILKRTEKNSTYFKASMTNGFKALKIAFTISKLEDAKVIELIKEKSKGLSSILLYGSAAIGEDGPDSDVDILVISMHCTVSAEEISRKLGKESGLKKYTIGEWKKISRQNRAFYLEAVSNSITLFGQKPVID